jgi:uncharacterized protein (TIGR02466 family)
MNPKIKHIAEEAGMDIHRYNLFPVPISHYENFLPLEIAQDVGDYILNKKIGNAQHHGAIQGDALSLHSTTFHDFIDELGTHIDSCKNIKTNIIKCINDFTDNTGIQRTTLTNSWFNIQNPGSYLLRHNHIGGEGARVSGALYIDVDESSSAIMFHNPNPYCYLSPIQSAYSYVHHTIKPKIGDLILFPSWLMHSSDNLNKTNNRIVISFNSN